MKARTHRISNVYLYTAWTAILTIGVVLALFGIQSNTNQDANRSEEAVKAQTVAFCHNVSDNNQSIRDILFLLSVDAKTSPDMTPSQLESIRVANERRRGYRLIAEDLFPLPVCSDGYRSDSKQDELLPLLETTPTTTSPTTQNGSH